MEILPHRYPFLMVDRVIALDDRKIIAIKNVSANEQYFVGHFVKEKVMPGVLMLEAMAQTAAIKAIKSRRLSKPTFYLLTINKAKFRHQVKPGDTLRLEALEMRSSGARVTFECKAFVGETLVSSMELLAMFNLSDTDKQQNVVTQD